MRLFRERKGVNTECNKCGLLINGEGVQTHLVMRGSTQTINVDVHAVQVRW